MLFAIIAVFVVAYAAIALEHPININKSASALIGAGLLWTIYALGMGDAEVVEEHLGETLIEIAQIVFFLMGAMTIVEVIDSHHGFEVITVRIKTTQLSSLMWLISVVTFFLSAALDNLTTTIVMVSLVQKLLEKHDDRLFFACIIVIAANAGGAWSPIGDVTTTMLWIGGQITTLAIIEGVFLASVANLFVPLLVVTWMIRGRPVVARQYGDNFMKDVYTTPFERNLMFYLGIGTLLAVPVFKTVTHLPPFMGVMFGLGILWLAGDLVHRGKDDELRKPLTLVHALSRIDMGSLVFFIGILLAVATLQHTGILSGLATQLDETVGRLDVIVLLIGLVSAVVDNVPIVAAAMGMYSVDQYPPDHFLWEFMAYSAGAGGPILIIGSAAGIAAMGLEKIHFFWYVKRISALALLGYLAGAGVYILQYQLMH
ncbi:MAG: sodium:proton antiporter NhaD [Gammaproteobacteria bacterium]